MPEKQQNLTLQAARRLVDHVAEPTNSQLKELLAAADKGANNNRKIIDLLCEYEYIRSFMDEQTSERGGTRGESFATSGGYSSVPGWPSSIPARHKWVCPENKEHWILVMQEGEAAPTCKVHKIPMQREEPPEA